MPAGTHEFEIEQGATWTREILVKDSLGVAIDLAGATARMQIRDSIESATFLIELSTSNGRIAIDGPAVKLTLTISAVDTATLMSGGVYDLEIVNVDATVDRLLEGNVILSFEVTR
jgi:hypothetical protein